MMGLRGGFGSLEWRAASLAWLMAVSAAAGMVGCGDSGGGGGGKVDSGTDPFGGESGGGTGGGDGGAVTGGQGGGGSQPGGAGGAPQGGGGGGGAGGVEPDASVPCTCERNLTCDAQGQCVERDPCAADEDCRAGRVCEAGACTDGCATDADCAGSGRADTCTEGRCVECMGDGDCFNAATCDLETHLCVEPAQCEDSRECIAPRICNIRTHGCQDPFDCRTAGASCNEGLVCDDASGRCVMPADGCVSNANCSPGQVCSESRPRLCRACIGDDECDGTQTCVAGECTDVVGCETDDDCIGNRVCTGGQCAAPACEDDASEDNDTPETAEQLGGGGAFDATSCGGDDDYFQFTLPRNEVATLTVTANGLGAELDVAVTDAQGVAVAEGNVRGLVEVVVVGPFLVDRPLIARVYQRGAGGSVDYQFDLGLSAAVGCQDDAADLRSNDDALESAQQLRPAGTPPIDRILSGSLCAGDPDWFCLNVADGEELRVAGAITSGNPTIQARLVQASDGSELQAETWTRGAEATPLSRVQRGNYCIHLEASEGEGAYDLHVSTASRALAAFCNAADELTLSPAGTAQAVGTLSDDDLIAASCGNAATDGGEVAYSLTLEQPKLLVARVTGEPGGTLGDPVVSLRGDCASPNGELACNDDRFVADAPYLLEANPAEIRVPILAAGTVTIVVDGNNPGERPDFRLDVEALPLAAPPANDRCAGAVPLELQDDLGRIRVNLDRAADDFAPGCLPASGPDAVYSLHVAERSRVSAQVFADFAVGVYLASACGGGDIVACGGGFDLDDVPAGDYFLVVEGVGAHGRGRVQGQVLVEPYGPPPANDGCATAEVLAGAGGELDASTRGASADIQLADGNACTGDNTSAGEVLYRLPVNGGASYFVEAVPEAGWDLSLYAVSDCARPGPTCLAGHDGALGERIEFTTSDADTEVFIVVDGANGESGRFHLTWGQLP